MNYYIVDAFTEKPFGGNPAGVVLIEKGQDFPSEAFMQHVAAEFRYSETAFVRSDAPREFTTRYFTPRGEVDLCGHATIATFGVLAHTGVVNHGDLCHCHTLAGDLEIEAGRQVMMQMARPQVVDTPIDLEKLHQIMNSSSEIHTDLPVEIISTGLPDIIMPVGDIEALNRLSPHMEALSLLSRQMNVVGVHAFALSDDGYTAHVRNFGPLYGIDEESATGTANAALTHYLLRHHVISEPAECRFLQGEAMGRPSVVATKSHNGFIYVGGHYCIIAAGNILVK